MVVNRSARGELKRENMLFVCFFPSPFGPETFASNDRAGRLFSRQPAHSPQSFSVIIIIITQLEINKCCYLRSYSRSATISPIMEATNKATTRKLALSRSDSVAYSRTFDYYTTFGRQSFKVICFIFKLPDWVPNRYKPAARGELIRKN